MFGLSKVGAKILFKTEVSTSPKMEMETRFCRG
jgi:hypothetical protein